MVEEAGKLSRSEEALQQRVKRTRGPSVQSYNLRLHPIRAEEVWLFEDVK